MHRNKKPDPSSCWPQICPVCGHSSYSLTGVHPQCEAERADEPRRIRLVAKRKAKTLRASLTRLNRSEFGYDMPLGSGENQRSSNLEGQ